MERQIVRAANKLVFEGRYVGNPLLAAAGEILASDYNRNTNPHASNGANRFATYVPPHLPPKPRSF